MERKVGERFKYEGITLMVVDDEGKDCDRCAFWADNCIDVDILDLRGVCCKSEREDEKSISFLNIFDDFKFLK